jgi:multisubunit Na+/H+ antiporter MnhB subunit
MTYARSMILRISVFGIPAIAVVGLVLLLNSLEASPGLALAAYALIAVSTGATIGYFADRLLGRPPNRTR